MAKELPFFKFEVSEWMLGRIQKQPLEVQGTFINLCCMYWHKLGEVPHSEACIDFNESHIKSLIDGKILSLDDGYLVIRFLDHQLDERKEVSRISSIKGKKSAELRLTRLQQKLTKVQPISTAVEPQSTSVQPTSTEEKRREEKREEKITPFDPSDYYTDGQTAFLDIQANELLIERLVRIVQQAGYKGCDAIKIMFAVKKFITIESAKEEFSLKPRKEVINHLVNWINKNVKNIDQYAGIQR